MTTATAEANTKETTQDKVSWADVSQAGGSEGDLRVPGTQGELGHQRLLERGGQWTAFERQQDI